MSKLRLGAFVAALLVIAVGVAACGSSKKSSTTRVTAVKSGKIAREVPARIVQRGEITVAADATYAPNEFIKPGSSTVVGMDADLAKAIGQVLGLKVKVVNATFDSIIPGLAAHKYDLGMSSFTDTKEREKTVDFVTYFAAGTSFYVKSQGGPAIDSLASLCGHSVAVEKGTTQQDDVTGQQKKCKSQGKPAIKLLVFPDQNGVNLALTSGRAQVAMADSPVALYQVKQTGGQLKLVGSPISYGRAPYGIAIPKNSGLAKPVLDAMKQLITNGQYAKILKNWGLSSGAINNPVINGAIS